MVTLETIHINSKQPLVCTLLIYLLWLEQILLELATAFSKYIYIVFLLKYIILFSLEIFLRKNSLFVEPVSVVHINILIGLFGLKRKEKSENDDPERDWALLFIMG